MEKILSMMLSLLRFKESMAIPKEQWKKAVHGAYKKVVRPNDYLFVLLGLVFVVAVLFEGYWFVRAIEEWIFPSHVSLHFSFLAFVVWVISIFCLLAATLAWLFSLFRRVLRVIRSEPHHKAAHRNQWVLFAIEAVLQFYVILISPPWRGVPLRAGTDIFDVTVYHWVNGYAGHNPILDAVMSFFAQYALEIYAVLFVVAWFALPRSDSHRRHALIVSVFAGVFALIINFVIAHIWFRPRPFTVLSKGDFTQLIPHGNDASFPSDHTSGSYAFAAASWGQAPKWVQYSFTIIAVIVMVARVYVGVHWPTDVLAGLVVGTISGRLMWKLSRLIYPVTVIGLRIFRYGEFDRKRSVEKN